MPIASQVIFTYVRQFPFQLLFQVAYWQEYLNQYLLTLVLQFLVYSTCKWDMQLEKVIEMRKRKRKEMPLRWR